MDPVEEPHEQLEAELAQLEVELAKLEPQAQLEAELA